KRLKGKKRKKDKKKKRQKGKIRKKIKKRCKNTKVKEEKNFKLLEMLTHENRANCKKGRIVQYKWSISWRSFAKLRQGIVKQERLKKLFPINVVVYKYLRKIVGLQRSKTTSN
ncbi:hypothetical protein RFI_02702, partial [Reticulomyxa filosa]